MNKFYLILLALTFSYNSFAQKIFTEPTQILANHSDDVDAMAISYSSKLLASGSWDKTIKIYKADSPFAFVRQLTGHTAPVTALGFNKTGKLLASGSNDFMVKIWDSLFRVRNFEGHKGNINCFLFENTMRYLFSGSDDRTIIAWDIQTGKPFRAINHGQSINCLSMAGNDPRFLYVAADEPKIKVYNLSTLQIARTFDGHTDAVNSIDISKNSLYMISGSNDKTARIWDIKTGKEIRKLAVDCWKVISVSFSDDAKYAVTGCNDGSIKTWDVETGKLVSSLENPGNGVHKVAFSQNLKTIICASKLRGSEQYGLRVWPTDILNYQIRIEDEKIKQAKADSIKSLKPLTTLQKNMSLKSDSTKKIFSKSDSIRLHIAPIKKGFTKADSLRLHIAAPLKK
jgi:WD40 repeat protein